MAARTPALPGFAVEVEVEGEDAARRSGHRGHAGQV
jgi:hypothetical protein